MSLQKHLIAECWPEAQHAKQGILHQTWQANPHYDFIYLCRFKNGFLGEMFSPLTKCLKKKCPAFGSRLEVTFMLYWIRYFDWSASFAFISCLMATLWKPNSRDHQVTHYYTQIQSPWSEYDWYHNKCHSLLVVRWSQLLAKLCCSYYKAKWKQWLSFWPR